jgi:glucokinase
VLSIGLDVGGTKTLAVALDDDREVVAQVRRATVRGPDGVLETLVAAATALADEIGEPLGALSAVGVGIPGVVDHRAGRVAHAVNLELREPLALGPALAHRLGLPVTVENDVNVAALGAAQLLGRADGDLALLSIGTGLGAGLVTGGRLRRGARGAAGEIGHVPVDPAGPLCACGQRGCLETLASGAALTAAWPVEGDVSSAAAVFAAAAHGDDLAARVRDVFAGHVAAGVRLLVLTCDVETVALGGGVSQVGPPLLDAVRAALRRQAGGSAFVTSLELPDRVALVPSDVPVGAIGAALAGMRR